jgi:hypothetical protein
VRIDEEYCAKDASPSRQNIPLLPGSASMEEAKQRFANALARVDKEFHPKEQSRYPPTHQDNLPSSSSASLEEAKERFENALARVEAELHYNAVPHRRQTSSSQCSSASAREAIQMVQSALSRKHQEFRKVVATQESHEVQLLAIKSEVGELKRDGEEKKSQIWLLQTRILRLEEKVRYAMETLEE